MMTYYARLFIVLSAEALYDFYEQGKVRWCCAKIPV
jgi:hypothetical protein